MAARYAVFGQPIAHSLSPRIHAAFARQCGIALDYSTIEAAPAEFTARLERFAAVGGRGANITLPLKERALSLCAEVSARARRAGSVNTLTRADDQWHGDTTDGTGLIRDLAVRHGIALSGRRCLLLGAGGAARAVAFALLDAGIGELVIANRTPERAVALGNALGDPRRVHSSEWQDMAHCGDFQLVLNATAAGHAAAALQLPSLRLGAQGIAYDLSYGDAAHGFLVWAREAGAAQALDGLGMLVEQAAEAFAIWHGLRPDTEAVYRELRAEG